MSCHLPVSHYEIVSNELHWGKAEWDESYIGCLKMTDTRLESCRHSCQTISHTHKQAQLALIIKKHYQFQLAEHRVPYCRAWVRWCLSSCGRLLSILPPELWGDWLLMMQQMLTTCLHCWWEEMCHPDAGSLKSMAPSYQLPTWIFRDRQLSAMFAPDFSNKTIKSSHVHDKVGSSQSSLTILPANLAVMSKGQSRWKGDAAAEHMTQDRHKCLEILDACPWTPLNIRLMGAWALQTCLNCYMLETWCIVCITNWP